MPVMGHAFVGWATARALPASPRAPVAGALWTPTLVTLAYLPDVALQVAQLVGLADAQVITHSVLLAMAAAPALAVVVAKLGAVSVRRALVIVLLSVLLHDGLDLLQGTDRRPWWPVSDRVVGPATGVLPGGAFHELLVFGGGFAVFAMCLAGWRRWRSGRAMDGAVSTGSSRAAWVGWTLTGLILACAGGTHYLRSVRERQLAGAWRLAEEGQHAAALALLDQAGRWPSTARPGRIDYARAEVFAARGDHATAVDYYLRAHRADPSYFWALADLAVSLASADAPPAERRRRTAPYVELLKRDFAGHEALARVLTKIERKLAGPATNPTSSRAEP